MEESAAYRDRIAQLYLKSRCGKKEAYFELEGLACSTLHPSPEDGLVAKGYLGDLLLICKSQLIPRNERRAKLLLSELLDIDRGTLTCRHLQHLLGVYYLDCCDGKESESVELFQQAADQGLAMSISTLGFCYDKGIGVRLNIKKAFSMYTLAAKKEYSVAQLNLAKCYDVGEGCEKDTAQAMEWFKKAADQGLATAVYSLGILYQYGSGDEANDTEAIRYFELAAEQGYAAAQYALAWYYYHGSGVAKDDNKAVQLCVLSAKQGDANAAQFLGQAHEFGWGVDVNFVEAMRYYRQAISIGGSTHDTSTSAAQVLALAEAYKEAVSSHVLCII
jgi:TPR repeat protein